jgi:hypothetical protein
MFFTFCFPLFSALAFSASTIAVPTTPKKPVIPCLPLDVQAKRDVYDTLQYKPVTFLSYKNNWIDQSYQTYGINDPNDQSIYSFYMQADATAQDTVNVFSFKYYAPGHSFEQLMFWLKSGDICQVPGEYIPNMTLEAQVYRKITS